MALAVQCALALDQVLTGHGTAVGISHRLRHALARQVAPAWRQAHPPPPARRPPCPLRGPDRGGGDHRPARGRPAAAPLHPAPPSPLAALRPRVLRAALRTPPGPAPCAPPSTTHGPDTPAAAPPHPRSSPGTHGRCRARPARRPAAHAGAGPRR